jgi:predicted RNA-binding Zn-ribbon protein involved in translation (DUF1610 family)
MAHSKKVICPKCGGDSSLRVHRNGFLQQSVLSLLGIYPWKCGGCGAMFLYRSRGHRPRSSRLVPKSSVADTNQDSQT